MKKSYSVQLLDVSVLLPLVDTEHADHSRVHQWFELHAGDGWATCPITENAVLRILSGANYPKRPGGPQVVGRSLQSLYETVGHVFWADDLSLLSAEHVDTSLLLSSRDVTDVYLLALAVARHSSFVTLDKRIASDAVRGGQEAVVLIV